MKLSPILLSVYNRTEHFKKCIESLKRCDLSNKSHLFIAIDAPYRDIDIDSNNQIIEYAKNISGFKEITLYIREENLGSQKNIDLAFNDVFKYYDRLIFSEDDNIFSTSFLVNINKCLEIYKSRKDIFSVSGWNMPFTLPQNYKNDIYIWQGMSAWGLGLWRDKWMSMDFNLNKVDYWLSNKKHLRKINSVAQHYYYGLKKMQKNKNLGGDGFVSNYLIENDMYSIFPSQTLVRNIGHDGKGNNSFFSNKFKNQLISNYLFNNLPIDILPDKRINKKLWWYFSNINRLKDRIDSSIIKFFS